MTVAILSSKGPMNVASDNALPRMRNHLQCHKSKVAPVAATPTGLAPTPAPLPSQHTPVAHSVSQIARRRSETRVQVRRWQTGPGRLPRLRSVVAIL